MANFHPKASKDALQQVKAHPTRAGFLSLLDKRPSLTAQEAMVELGDGPATLRGYNYHLWILCQHGFVEPTGSLTDRGLPYRLTRRGRVLVDVLKRERGCT